MGMANVKLTSEVEAIFRSSKIEGNKLFLPDVMLERKLYVEVNKALVLAGGKWNRSAKAHVFDGDPSEKIFGFLEGGVMVDKKKELQAFYTPESLAHRVVQLANVEGRYVLEPSAGNGALADMCLEHGASSVNCIEISPEEATKLRNKGYATREGDFMETPVVPVYDRIVMNPPFSKNQDVKHIKHALGFLREDGILVAVTSPNKDRKGYKDLLDRYDCETFEVDAGEFKKSGTGIATSILKITL